jgi:hypothetical protein
VAERVKYTVFFDITFVACAASPIESPVRGGRNVATGFIPCHYPHLILGWIKGDDGGG